MKKNYINPLVNVVRIQTSHIIASSPVNFTESGGSAKLNEGTASGNALGRRSGSLWDDDEENDY